MRPDELLALLGREATDVAIERTLVSFGIRKRPEVERDEEDVDGPTVETKDWVINSRAGIEFGFEDKASFLGQDEAERGAGPMLLTQLYFYGDHEGVKPYRGSLPFGLELDDNRNIVRAKLVAWEGSRRSYLRDTWELPEFRMTVSYIDEGAHIDFILCLLRPPAIPVDANELTLLPTRDEILGVLGKPLLDPAFQTLLAPLGVERHMEDQGEGRIADFRERFGFELRFRRQKASPGLLFSHVVFYRDREMDARGWPGALPRDLKFDDSPERLLQKIGSPPDNLANETFVGYALWHLPEYSIQVKYSTIDNLILCVHVMLPGAWDAY
jgi:hypothetical protein